MAANSMTEECRWDYSTDLLVVGSGAGGMTTAVVASDLGADVIVIEKSDLYGGTTAISGGNVWIPCNPQMRAMGCEDTIEEALTYLKHTVGNDVEEDKLQAYIETGPSLIQYLHQHTPIKFIAGPLPDYYSNLPGGKRQYRALEPSPISGRRLGSEIHRIRPPHPQTLVAGVSFTTGEIATVLTRRPGWLWTVLKVVLKQFADLPWLFTSRLPKRLTLGAALIARCFLAVKHRNIPLWKNTSLVELISENGRIIGIVAKQQDKTIRIAAKQGVVIAAGGFSHNATMRELYLQQSPNVDWSVATRENTGDGIKAGIAAGAATDLMDEAWWIPVYRLPESRITCGMFMERSFPGCIIVNQRGERYLNEAANYDAAGREMVRASREGNDVAPSYYIFDSRFRQHYMAGPMLPMPKCFDAMMSKEVKKLVVKARSLAEMADKLGLDVQIFEDTVSTHNHYAHTGIDTDFSRGVEAYERHYSDPTVTPNSTLAPITVPPFYAIPIYPGDIGTKGGLLTDAHARVLNTSGVAIPGLYAIGNSSASIMGRSYPGGGATIGPSMVFGARAAMNATGKSL